MSQEPAIVAEVVFRSLFYIFGCVGNLLVIFFILILGEHKKVTHWYVLQLAIADFVFLQTLPFRISEVLERDWIYPVWACKAKQTVFFFNYYSSIIFLVIMALDRYVAVCHSFSSAFQRLRSTKSVFVVTACVWSISLLLCIPTMMYSNVSGVGDCFCGPSFPVDILSARTSCREINEETDICIQHYRNQPTCIRSADYEYEYSGDNETNDDYESDSNYTSNSDNTNQSQDTPTAPTVQQPTPTTNSRIDPMCQFPRNRPGMHIFVYFNFIAMFLLPLVVIAICYFLIAMRLSRTMATGPRKVSTSAPSDTDGNSHSGRVRLKSVVSTKSEREKSRVTMMCVVLVSLFIVCWLPFHGINVAKVEGIRNQKPQTCENLSNIASVFAYLNSVLNPYLYNFLGSFRKKLRQVQKTSAMQSFLSATGMTRMVRRTSENASSSGAFNSSGRTRRNTAHNATSGSPEEGIPLETNEL